MNLYFDTSALVKRYVRETGSEDVSRWIADAGLIATSLITRAEMNAAFARAVRMGNISQLMGEKAMQLLETHWSSYLKVSVTEKCISRASRLAWNPGLRGYDAVHLASAELWQIALGEPVILVTFDQQLAAGGRQIGLEVLS
jgi:predicted nucleic acid-binding protein